MLQGGLLFAVGAPVAIVRLPLEADDRGARRAVLDRLHCSAGQITVGGYTEESGNRDAQAATATQSTEKETRQR